ncbi:hypothetical protein AB9P05_14650 [Roseivirga sp. BDSF3-8]|uniref:hypothetical protein n=1 Tax=Roseivirga sp. BDSF3-8 TaxID=3241598 RepID=UPI00353272C9
MDWINIALYTTYGLIIVGVILAILAPLVSSFSNPAGLVKSGVGILALVVLFFVSYALAGDEVTGLIRARGFDAETVKTVGGALILMYILFGIAVVSIVITELLKLVR